MMGSAGGASFFLEKRTSTLGGGQEKVEAMLLMYLFVQLPLAQVDCICNCIFRGANDQIGVNCALNMIQNPLSSTDGV